MTLTAQHQLGFVTIKGRRERCVKERKSRRILCCAGRAVRGKDHLRGAASHDTSVMTGCTGGDMVRSGSMS